MAFESPCVIEATNHRALELVAPDKKNLAYAIGIIARKIIARKCNHQSKTNKAINYTGNFLTTHVRFTPSGP